MAIWTISDPKLPTTGTTAVKVAAGIAYVGEDIEMTAAEKTALESVFTLQSGAVAVTPKVTPYKKYTDAKTNRANRRLD